MALSTSAFYPNRTAKVLDGTLVVSLFDISGRKIGTNTYVKPAETFDYSLPTNHAGVYLLEIVASGRRVVKKVVVAGM